MHMIINSNLNLDLFIHSDQLNITKQHEELILWLLICCVVMGAHTYMAQGDRGEFTGRSSIHQVQLCSSYTMYYCSGNIPFYLIN